MKTFNPLQKSRQRRLNIRLSEEEWEKLHKLAGNTTSRSMSEYSRKILLNKPVKVFYRNQSFDDFEEQMTRLLPQLEDDRDKYDQVMKKLLALEQIPEIKETLPLLQFYQERIWRTQEEIRAKIEKIADQCDQK
jgi:mobilization protein MobC